ncbi:unnamed protein product [Boreogadus saida]
MSREKRAKTTVKALLGDLREKNLINEELSEKLAFYSDLKMDFVAKQGHEYTQNCRVCTHAPSSWSKGIQIPQRDSKFSPPTSTNITKVAAFGGCQAWPEQDDAGYAGEKMPGRPD